LTRVARFACRCALLIKKPVLNSKTPAHPVKSAHAAIVRIVAHVGTVKVAETVAPAVTVAADVIVAPEEMVEVTAHLAPKVAIPTSYQRS
jgi:hypothetical protein